MAKDISIGIAGATGVVGSELINILTERDFNCSNVRLFASKNSAGELYSVCGQEVTVEQLDEAEFDGLDLVFLAAGGSVSEEYAPKIVEAGAVVIDKSSFFRMNDDVPLVVPEVNGSALTKENRIIATPNCSTIQLVPVLKVIHEAAGLKRVILSTYQAVSGAGKNAMDELWEQTRAIYAQEELEHEAFAHQIAFNCIPHIDTLLDDGNSKE